MSNPTQETVLIQRAGVSYKCLVSELGNVFSSGRADEYLLVNRGGDSFKLATNRPKDAISDSDVFLVNYEGASYQASGSYIKSQLTPPLTQVYVTIISGGGAGGSGGFGSYDAGGGGAGGYYEGNVPAVYNTTYQVVVGAGGFSGNGQNPLGSKSSFSSKSTTGGGNGGVVAHQPGSAGGSGGGGSGGGGAGGNGYAGEGFTGATGGGFNLAGGGGGAGGSPPTDQYQKWNGGPGKTSSIDSTLRAAGGNGGQYNVTTAPGQPGGGGQGAIGANGQKPTAGATNTGSGGGGTSNNGGGFGGNGGSGIILIRTSLDYGQAYVTGSPTITVAGGYRIYKYIGSGTIRFNNP